ncbi:MAG: hypothetical protein H5T61_08825 [Thermoflexales bacterium]|nr:hypothetical protein [Thermoflexales bacterium]
MEALRSLVVKKLLYAFNLVGILALALTACGGERAPSPASPGAPSTPTTVPSPTPSVVPSQPPPVSIQVNGQVIALERGRNVHTETYDLLMQDPEFASRMDWVFMDGMWIPLAPGVEGPLAVEDPSLCRAVLFARDRDLWRTNLYGDRVEQLTEGKRLNWEPGEDDWWVNALSAPVQVSPDGRWLTFLGEHTRFLIDVRTRTEVGLPILHALPAPHAPTGDWSPDSRYFAYGTDEGLYLYNIQQNGTTRLVDSPMLGRAEADVREVVWSPDGRFIGFACCFAPAPEEPDAWVGQVWKLEYATRQMERVGEIRAYVAKSNPLCWTAEGQLAAAEELADGDQDTRCSKLRLAAFPLIGPVSPDGTKQIALGPSSPDDSSWTGPSLLRVVEAATGQVLSQREIPWRVAMVSWSLDGQYLFLDDGEGTSPIWRVRADGRWGLLTVVEDGFLLGVIPQWCY